MRHNIATAILVGPAPSYTASPSLYKVFSCLSFVHLFMPVNYQHCHVGTDAGKSNR